MDINETNKDKHKNTDKKKEKTFKSTLKEFKGTILFIVFTVIMFKLVVMNCFIPTSSMSPTIPEKSFMLATRIFKSIENGDVVVFEKEEYPYLLTKRVIGKEGDIVEIKDNKVYVNDSLEPQSNVYGITYPQKQSKYIVPKNCVFLLGDNRENSEDARYWETPFVNKKSIRAKGMFEYGLPIFSNDKGIHSIKGGYD